MNGRGCHQWGEIYIIAHCDNLHVFLKQEIIIGQASDKCKAALTSGGKKDINIDKGWGFLSMHL